MLSTCIHLLALVLAGRCYPRSPVSPARVLLAPDAQPTAHLQKVLLGDVHIRALVGQVVLGFHVLVEDVERHLDEGGVGHPGAIVAVLDFPQLVCLHLQVQCSASGQSGNSWVVLPLPQLVCHYLQVQCRVVERGRACWVAIPLPADCLPSHTGTGAIGIPIPLPAAYLPSPAGAVQSVSVGHGAPCGPSRCLHAQCCTSSGC